HPAGNGDPGVIVDAPPPSQQTYTFVGQMPEFIGDRDAYLSNNLRYPEAARDAGIEGKVVIQFVVNEEGNISDAVVVRGIGGGCNEEALRVVKSMPRWKPGKNNGQPVKVKLTLPINFTLNG